MSQTETTTGLSLAAFYETIELEKTSEVIEFQNGVTVPATSVGTRRLRNKQKKVVPVSTPRPAPKSITSLGVVDQVKLAFLPKNRFATFCGLLIGGFVPAATYVVGHYETALNLWMWILVAGGLIFSAKTVFDWANIAFQNPWKAAGFVLLIEGVMTFAHTQILSVIALLLLVTINGVATGCRLVADQVEKKG